MQQRYLVRGKIGNWFQFFRIVAAIVAVIGLGVMVFGDFLLGMVVLIGGMAWSLGMEFVAQKMRSQRTWIEVQPDGFLVLENKGERKHRDHEVVSIAYDTKPKYANGKPNGFHRKCQFWFASAPPVVMDGSYAEGESDPMAPLIERVVKLLRLGYSAALSHGLAVQGDGWHLTSKELHCQVQGSVQNVHLSDITAVENYEGKMGVWVRGHDDPIVRFPIAGRNVWLLPGLIEPYKAKDEKNGPPLTGLGRVLFRKGSTRSTAILLAAFAGLLVLIAVCLTPVVLKDGDRWPLIAICLGLAAAMGVAAWSSATSQFRCHEWGVFKSNIAGQRQLMYKDVASFSYQATRNYYNGAYSGTTLVMRFDPFAGAGKSMSYSTTVQGGDEDFDNLRDFVAKSIASQMQQRLAAGQDVAWTANLTFQRNGLVYRPNGFVGRKAATLLPYDQYRGFNMDQGIFYLFSKSEPKAIMNETVAAPNFFPGFYLLLSLMHADDAAEVPEGTSGNLLI